MYGERTPSITVLLPILIGKRGLETSPMQVQLHHISSRETQRRQASEEQL
jgi:hypothetical protein